MENWKDIEGYEGIYQISDLGRVKSIKFSKERILKPSNSRKGYLFVDLFDPMEELRPSILIGEDCFIYFFSSNYWYSHFSIYYGGNYYA